MTDGMQILFSSEIRKIGKHEWRIVVVTHERYGRVTAYQWRKVAHELAPRPNSWRSDREWPTYNGDDGIYCGLPKTLIRIYEKQQDEIGAALEGSGTGDEQLLLF